MPKIIKNGYAKDQIRKQTKLQIINQFIDRAKMISTKYPQVKSAWIAIGQKQFIQ